MSIGEYINEASSMVSSIKYNHLFTDRNGAYHENGYKPDNEESLDKLLRVLIDERGNTGDFNDIDVSEIRDMSYMFEEHDKFNGDITGWDTSKVKSMHGMFYGATSFNQPIGSWDTSSVEDMSYMFFEATSFNQPLETRNVRRVDDMSYMFYQATSFNQDLSNRNTNGIWGMNYMFSETTVHTAMHDTLNRILTKIWSALKR